MNYNKKVLLTLFFITFSLSTLLSVSGLSNEIANYYAVNIETSTLYLGLFLFVVEVTALFLPAYLSKYERKRFFIISLAVTVITCILQMFTTNFMIGLILRIIPAFFYSTAISFALTYIGDVDPNNTNKVVLGITAGAIFGASFSIYLTTCYGYYYALLWIALINLASLIMTILFIPRIQKKTKGIMDQFHCAKSRLFIISICSILCIGIGVSVTYNFFTLILETITELPCETISFYLFFNGLAGIFGTSLIGRFMQKNLKLTLFAYPTIFILVMLAMFVCIEMDETMFFILILFGFLDGSMQTIAQYTISSAAKETPEFANGFYLFIVNLNRTIGIILGGMLIESWFTASILLMSILAFGLSVPFIVYRFKKFAHINLAYPTESLN